MGRGGRKAGRGRSGRPDSRIEEADMKNDKMQSYYKAQNVVSADEEEEMWNAFRRPLPTTFRLTGNRGVAEPLSKLINNVHVPFLTGIVHNGQTIPPPQQLPWYPNQWAWQLTTEKSVIRRNESFKKFQNFLVYETEAGNISRQEAVSMIPPLMLDVQPGQKVLDMCAAPGSKTVQLLEALNGQGRDQAQQLADEGLLVANDSDAKRCYMLVHQTLNRMPSINMLITNHDAAQLPTLRYADKDGKHTQPLLFDRILADVPCSGDGTLRKNSNIWRDWRAGNGLGLHALQLRILERGLELLKPGGRLVYSTCSLNPLEDEAVVSAVLQRNSNLSLIDVSSTLPELKRSPGLTSWKVCDKDDHFVDSPEDRRGRDAKVLPSTLWPCGREAELQLERCCRILPHQQDTGGFFVAVLHKAAAEDQSIKSVVDEKRSGPAVPADAESSAERPAKRARVQSPDHTPAAAEAPSTESTAAPPIDENGAQAQEDTATATAEAVFKEDPYTYIASDNPEIQICRDFFDLSPDFDSSCLLVRNAAGQAIRTVYYTSDLVRRILEKNSYKRMRLISCGTKIFVRQDPSKDGTYRCKWRIAAEGLSSIRPFLGPRRLARTDVDTFKVLMANVSALLDSLPDEAFKSRLLEMEPGSAILEVTVPKSEMSSEQNICVPIWRGPKGVNLMVEKLERRAMSLRVFGEDLTPQTKEQLSKANAATSEKTGDSTAGQEDEAVAAATAEESQGQQPIEAETTAEA